MEVGEIRIEGVSRRFRIHAREARTLVATPRELDTLQRASVELDALVGSGDDDGERYRPGDLDPPPRLVVATAGALGTTSASG